MKKSLKLLSIGAAAAVWMGLAGTMFVYVVSDQGLFSAHKPGTGGGNSFDGRRFAGQD